MNPQFLVSRKWLLLFLPLTFVLLFYFSMFTPGLAQNSEVREIENQIPEHLPIKVKLKKEKEEKIKNLENDQWVRDFELEVTNTSDKPIYFLDFVLMIPEVTSESGGTLGMPLRYGRMAFLKQATRAQIEDVPIKPGDTYIFKIPERDQKGWYAHKAIGYMKDPKTIQLVFLGLSFGDGTGFRGTTGVPYPRNKQESKVGLGKSSLEATAKPVMDARSGFLDLGFQQRTFDVKPAAWLPVRFSGSPLATEPQSGLCCPGTPCSFLKDTTYYCSCKEAQSVDTASCSDAGGQCATSRRFDSWCEDLGVGCPEYFINTSCQGSATPTPTPPPPPPPPPSPPTQCPAGSFNPDSNGNCPPYAYNNGGCCVCLQQDHTCPTCCLWIENDCACGGVGGPCGGSCPSNNCAEGTNAVPEDNCAYPCTGCPQNYVNVGGGCCQPSNPSPIIVDVDGSGFRLTSAADGVWFDFYDTGGPIKISWTANYSTNAFLVLDRDGNGRIDSGKELFGNLTPQPRSRDANGFLALAEYDKRANGGNRDGVIDSRDNIFASLRLWQDANHNGSSEPSELRSLSEAGLKTLDLDYKESRRTDEYGNRFRYRAKVKDTHNAQIGRWAWDVFLVTAQ